MSKLNDISVKSKLLAVAALSATGIAIFAVLAFKAIGTVKIGSAMDRELDVVTAAQTDFTPPPDNLMGASLDLHEIGQATDRNRQTQALERFRSDAKEFEAGHEHYMDAFSDPLMRDLLTRAYDPGHQFLEIAENEYLPAVIDGDQAKANSIRITRLAPLYTAQQDGVQAVLNALNQRQHELEQKIDALVSSELATLAVFGAVIALVVFSLSWMVGNGIARRLSNKVDVLNRVANGDLTAQVSADGADELGRVAGA
ncbi:MAG TPA: methyl-accepting chemotaxis protein, partial [Candidatus Binataceae bacterium]|nr:methyl-accepting chemotaxis protein [Candidatus Binataceae bacterium]